MVQKEAQCRVCRIVFTYITRRGRPPVECSECSVSESTVIREWAQEQGLDIPTRGRIPGFVIEAYNSRQVLLSPEQRVDRLESMLRGQGTHISQHSH